MTTCHKIGSRKVAVIKRGNLGRNKQAAYLKSPEDGVPPKPKRANKKQ